MTKTQSPHTPKICKHKGTGQAYVTLSGHRHYLGQYGEPATHQRGHTMIAEWLANGKRLRVEPQALLVVELIAGYLDHVEATYKRADGTPSTATVDNITLALSVPKSLYGHAKAVDFGPLALRACINKWIGDNLRRTTINRRLGDVKRAFRWAASMEMIPASIPQALGTVEGLRMGRSAAKESKVVHPVSETALLAIEPHVSRPVWGLARLQWLCGARSSEILGLRRCDINTEGKVWTAKIAQHKGALRGRVRTLCFGKQAQAVLAEFIGQVGPFEPLFSPKLAEAERHAEAKKCHRRPNQKPNPKITDRELGNTYTPESYRRAITRACDEAKIDHWHPHQLRHAFGTRVEREFGLAAAAAALGHSDVSVTRIDAQLDTTKAVEVAAAVG